MNKDLTNQNMDMSPFSEYKSVSDVIPEPTKVGIETVLDAPILITQVTFHDSQEFGDRFAFITFRRIDDGIDGLEYGASCGGSMVVAKLASLSRLQAFPIKAVIRIPVGQKYYTIE